MIYWKLYKIDESVQYNSSITKDAKTMVVGGPWTKSPKAIQHVKEKRQGIARVRINVLFLTFH